MSETLIAIVVLALFAVFVFIEMPIGLCVGFSGIIGISLYEGVETATNVLGSSPFTATAKYALFVIPMYVLLGSIINHAGIAAQIYRSVNRVVGRLPGGLAATAVIATSAFSGISGSSSADVAVFGKISVSEMSKYGYTKDYAAAVVAAAGTFAVLIPPSIVLVIYGIIAQLSIGALLLAGIIPGVFSALLLVAFVLVKGVFDNRGTPVHTQALETVGAISNSVPATYSDRDKILTVDTNGASNIGEEIVDPNQANASTGWAKDSVAIVYAFVLFVLVIGGIYSGIFTATEAGAVGAAAAAVIAVVASRSTGTNLRLVFTRSVRETVDVTGMIFFLLIGGAVFTYFVATSGIADQLAELVTNLDVPPSLIIAIILVMLIPLGMFLDGLSIMLLIVPIAAPVVSALGFDGIWFGILVIKMIEVSLLTPPVGINVFIICGIVNLPIEKVFRRITPFILLDLAITAVLFAFPDIILWLPRMAGLA